MNHQGVDRGSMRATAQNEHGPGSTGNGDTSEIQNRHGAAWNGIESTPSSMGQPRIDMGQNQESTRGSMKQHETASNRHGGR